MHKDPSQLALETFYNQRLTSLSPFHNVLNATCAPFGSPCDSTSSSRTKLTEAVLWRKKTRPWTALEDLVEQTGRNRRSLPDELNIIASALLEISRWTRAKVEENLSKLKGWKKLSYCDGAGYDETPMHVVVSESGTADQLQQLVSNLASLPLCDHSSSS